MSGSSSLTLIGIRFVEEFSGKYFPLPLYMVYLNRVLRISLSIDFANGGENVQVDNHTHYCGSSGK